MQTPIIIIGGGPAGAATAIALRQRQTACAVLAEAEAPALKPGETLPPNAALLLRQLEVAALVSGGQHQPCTGNQVHWGMDAAQTRPFFAEPHGNGWHLNRAVFEQQLRAVAVEKGAQWLGGWRCVQASFQNKQWLLQCQNSSGATRQLEAPFVIDATGRTARLARMMGVKRRSLDTLTGCYGIVNGAPPSLNGTTFIEAVEDGWWYAAPLRDGRLVINFMTDAGLHTAPGGNLAAWLYAQLQRTRHLRQHLRACTPGCITQTLIKPASTSYLEQITGPGWLAVGDAAFTYDPLSSYGITAALGGAVYAAFAVTGWQAGQPEAMDAYTLVQQQTFNNCLAMLQHQYSLEKRWPNSAFWQRRTGQAQAVHDAVNY